MKNWKKKQRFLFMAIMGIGFLLILDGVVSMCLQPDQNYIFHTGRGFRIFMGIVLIGTSCLLLKKGKKHK